MYPVVHKIKNKDKATSKSKKKMKKKKILKCYSTRTHIYLSATTQDYPLGYRGIMSVHID